MSQLSYVATLLTIPAIALAAVVSFPHRGEAGNKVQVTCDTKTSVPTIIATLFNQEQLSEGHTTRSQTTPILSFLPEYFSSEEASLNCQRAAKSLQVYYTKGTMNYLASDTIKGKPVVCALKRRGLSCDSHSSEILFSLNKSVSPTTLLYDMLGSNFKGSQIPSSRTVSRIYTDLRPSWWPF